MIEMLKGLFASIPYDVQSGFERHYQSLMYLVFKLGGMQIIEEFATNVGWIDAVLNEVNIIYNTECKLN